jgi:hypothetical protein
MAAASQTKGTEFNEAYFRSIGVIKPFPQHMLKTYPNKRTPNQQREYNNLVKKIQSIDNQFRNISLKLKKRAENPVLSALLHNAMYANNPTTRKIALNKYFKIINAKKTLNNRNKPNNNNPKSAKHPKLNPNKN